MTETTTHTMIYYINDSELSSEQLVKEYDSVYGLIRVVFSDEMDIVSFRANSGNGYGTQLFLYACNEARKKGISIVKLDDCSSRYRQDHNIYTKLGMKYEDAVSGPEMHGNVEDILKSSVPHKHHIYSTSL